MALSVLTWIGGIVAGCLAVVWICLVLYELYKAYLAPPEKAPPYIRSFTPLWRMSGETAKPQELEQQRVRDKLKEKELLSINPNAILDSI
jgi:hypothetical protein